MHSGGATSNVVSVAPATPIVKHMIGIAALVLEGRDRGVDTASTTTNTKSKDPPVMGTSVMIPRAAPSSSSGSGVASNALYTSLDAMAVAAAMATNSTSTTSNWARAQNNRLAHIYRLKNRLLVESSSASGQSNSPSNRSSPVPLDYDQLAMGSSGGASAYMDDEAFGGGVFDPMHHLTSARTCRLTTPRSFLNLQMVEKRQTSTSSSCSSTGSMGVAATTPSVATGTVPTSSGGPGQQQQPLPMRRNSRSSPVPVIPAMAMRTHCDDFLRTIGLIKGAGGQAPVTGKVPVTAPLAVNKASVLVVEDESHYCDEVVNSEVITCIPFRRKAIKSNQ